MLNRVVTVLAFAAVVTAIAYLGEKLSIKYMWAGSIDDCLDWYYPRGHIDGQNVKITSGDYTLFTLCALRQGNHWSEYPLVNTSDIDKVLDLVDDSKDADSFFSKYNTSREELARYRNEILAADVRYRYNVMLKTVLSGEFLDSPYNLSVKFDFALERYLREVFDVSLGEVNEGAMARALSSAKITKQELDAVIEALFCIREREFEKRFPEFYEETRVCSVDDLPALSWE